MTATSQSPRRRHFIEWVFCLLLMVLAAPAGAATKNILLVIAAGPDIVSPGRTNAAVVHVVDLFATILELAGVDAATALPRALTSTEQTNLDQLRVKLAA